MNESEVELAIAETVDLAKRLLADEKRAEDTGAHLVVLFNTASKTQGDAQIYSRQGQRVGLQSYIG